MQRVVFRRFGPPEDVVELVDESIPAPRGREVLIDIEAAPVHIADLKFMSGELPFYKPLPGTPGMEGIGAVRATGSEVTRLSVGDRVFLPVRVGTHGAWRQQVVLNEDQVMAAPEGDALQLCLVPINGLTAFTLLEGVLPLRSGDWLIQNAANSNCGRYLMALARRRGIRTVNVVRRAALIDELKDLGGDVVLLDGPDLAGRVRTATDGAPIPLGIDAVAGSATQRIADCVADGAMVLAYGMLSGDPCSVRPETLFMRNLTLKGFLTFTVMDTMDADTIQRAWSEIPALVAGGDLNTKIAATYTLDRVHEAVRHAARTGADRDGKIVILPNG